MAKPVVDISCRFRSWSPLTTRFLTAEVLLSLSENTVRNYMFRSLDKLGTSNRVKVTFYAVRQQI
jgi:hypothetical protein